MVICVLGYAALVLGIAHFLRPHSSDGSLLNAPDGRVVGSRLIAQKFEQPKYFWPRPSAAGKDGFDAMSAAGSNKSPTSSDLTERASAAVTKYAATAEKPLPAELAAASGSGLDPHISEHAALYQAKRVADARGLPLSRVESMIKERAFAPGGVLAPDRLVNVLELNLALDSLAPTH
jgi:K+-transporting ATPase ATPase C chain